MQKTINLFHKLIINTNEKVKNQIEIRNQVFLFTSLFVLILGLIFTGFNLIYSINNSQNIETSIYLLSFGALILAVFGKDISESVRVSLILLFLYTNGILVLSKWGLQSTGQLYLFLIPIVTAVLKRKSATVIGIFINIFSFVLLKIVVNLGLLESPELLDISTYNWVIFSISFISFNSLITIFIYQLVNMFLTETDAEIIKIENLSSEMEKLNRVNAQFQSIIEENKQFSKSEFQTQRLESVGRLTSGIANEFNNLITVIVGYTDILLSISSNDDMYNRLLNKVRISGKAAESLVGKLLAFSKNLVLKNKIVNLNDTLLKMESDINLSLPKNIKLNIQLPSTNYLIKIDPVQLEKMILELVSNSKDALPDGGEIKIKVKSINFNEKYIQAHEMESAGEYVVLSVEDNGIGIDKSTKEHIFEPFFSTKEVGEALGLGLSVIYGVVKQCGGNVEVKSTAGKGTKVNVFLLSRHDKLTFQKDDKIIPGDLKGNERILLVEDDQLVRSVIVEVLNNYGYNLITAANGIEGLETYKKSKNKIDLVIADIVMPKMSGTELIEEIVKIDKEIKVLFMSGYVEKVHNLQDQGLNYIKKPFDPLDLVKKIRFVLDTKIISS